MRYLLDTNIVSDLVRRPQGRTAQRIREVGEAQVCTSIIVAAELRYGAAKRATPRLAAQLEAVLGVLDDPAVRGPGRRHLRAGCVPASSGSGARSAATIC